MPRTYFRAIAALMLVGAFYFVHRFLLWPAMVQPRIRIVNFSYAFNLIFSGTLISSAYLLSKITKDHLGFYFLASIGLKILFFVLLFKKLGFKIGHDDYLHFLIPFTACLVIEAIYFIKMLGEPNFSQINDLE